MDQPTNQIVGDGSVVAFFARTPFVTTCGVASMLLFLVSLTQDCFFIDRAEDPRAWANGFGLLTVGWLGVFTGVYAWLANPTLLIAWLAMWSPAHRIYSLGASVVAMLLALSFLLHDNILADEAGNRAMITGYGPGYWLWISSSTFAMIGSSSWYIDLSNHLGLRMKHNRARLLASAVGFMCVIAAAMAGFLLQGILVGLAAAFAVEAVIERSRKTRQPATNVPSSPIDPTKKPNASQAKRSGRG